MLPAAMLDIDFLIERKLSFQNKESSDVLSV